MLSDKRNMKKQKVDKINLTIWIAILLLIGIVGVIVFQYLQIWSSKSGSSGIENATAYKYHCAFITKEYEDPFWNSIYEGARKEGKKNSIYIENYGEKLALPYSVDDLMEMAIAAGVDSIILEGNHEASTGELIDEAMKKDITVVTVYKDNVGSKRCSFIGMNNFRMGYKLCSQAVNGLASNRGEIMVLFDGSEENTENTIITSGMQKILEERGSKAVLNAQTIDSSESYNAEEGIRNLLRNVAKRPSVLICTTLIQTQCAYQAVVDLNCVGEVRIIGFYATQTILEAIEKDIIEASYVADTEMMGRKAVESIEEYRKYGYVSDYISVDAQMVDRDSAFALLEEMSQ